MPLAARALLRAALAVFLAFLPSGAVMQVAATPVSQAQGTLVIDTTAEPESLDPTLDTGPGIEVLSTS